MTAMPMTASPDLFLVVDDEPLFVRSVIDVVGAARPGLRVLSASNGVEALDIIEREEVAVLFTDLRMPAMDGFQLLAQLMSRRFKAPIIVATAFGTAMLERRLKALPGVHYLEKPIDIDQLLTLLDQLVSEGLGEKSRGLGAFLQLLASEQKTVLVHLQSEQQSGHLAFLDGSLVDARAGNLRGDAAAREILRWPGLTLQLKEGVIPRARTVEASLQELLDATRAVTAAHGNGHNGHAISLERARRSISRAMEIGGALGAALVDYESGMTLGASGSKLNVELAACGNTEVVRAKMAVIDALKLEETIEDILITLGQQYHLIRPLAVAPNFFLYLALDRAAGNLGMARRQLSVIEKELCC